MELFSEGKTSGWVYSRLEDQKAGETTEGIHGEPLARKGSGQDGEPIQPLAGEACCPGSPLHVHNPCGDQDPLPEIR